MKVAAPGTGLGSEGTGRGCLPRLRGGAAGSLSGDGYRRVVCRGQVPAVSGVRSSESGGTGLAMSIATTQLV